MKEIFCKIHETETHQILITKCFDEEEQKSTIRVETISEDCSMAAEVGYDTNEQRDAYFDKIDLEEAKKILKDIFKIC